MEQAKTEYVITTRPVIPPYSKHPTLPTIHPNIILRPYQIGDLDALHELRTQIEVMKWTSTGKIDADIDKTKTWMSRFMDLEEDLHSSTDQDLAAKVKAASSGASTFNFVIVYRDVPSATDKGIFAISEKVIGAGGCHIIDPEPECGYMIRKEYWGRGIATAVVRAVVDAYWKLERKPVKIPRSTEHVQTSSNTSDTSTPVIVQEVLNAQIEASNIASQRVLEKCGFTYVKSETIEENGGMVELAHYILPRP